MCMPLSPLSIFVANPPVLGEARVCTEAPISAEAPFVGALSLVLAVALCDGCFGFLPLFDPVPPPLYIPRMLLAVRARSGLTSGGGAGGGGGTSSGC